MAAIVHDFKFQFMILLVFSFFSSPKKKSVERDLRKSRSSFEKNKIRKFSIYQTDKKNKNTKKREFFILLWNLEFSMLCDMHFFVRIFFETRLCNFRQKFIDVRESIYLRIFTLHSFFFYSANHRIAS